MYAINKNTGRQIVSAVATNNATSTCSVDVVRVPYNTNAYTLDVNVNSFEEVYSAEVEEVGTFLDDEGNECDVEDVTYVRTLPQ